MPWFVLSILVKWTNNTYVNWAKNWPSDQTQWFLVTPFPNYNHFLQLGISLSISETARSVITDKRIEGVEKTGRDWKKQKANSMMTNSAFCLISSSRDYYLRFAPLETSCTFREKFEPAQSRRSDSFEWNWHQWQPLYYVGSRGQWPGYNTKK